MCRHLANLPDVANFDELAFQHDADPMAQLRHQMQVVGNEQN
jgi:hypothetical protein